MGGAKRSPVSPLGTIHEMVHIVRAHDTRGGLVNLLSSACNRPPSSINTLFVCDHRQTLEPDQWSRLAGCLAAVMFLLGTPMAGFPRSIRQYPTSVWPLTDAMLVLRLIP
jgi:hypothetical protein